MTGRFLLRLCGLTTRFRDSKSSKQASWSICGLSCAWPISWSSSPSGKIRCVPNSKLELPRRRRLTTRSGNLRRASRTCGSDPRPRFPSAILPRLVDLSPTSGSRRIWYSASKMSSTRKQVVSLAPRGRFFISIDKSGVTPSSSRTFQSRSRSPVLSNAQLLPQMGLK